MLVSLKMKLHHKIYGNGSETLFILHGLFGMLDNWHQVAQKLSESLGWTVITVDQRNHGYSPHSDEMSYALMADDLKALADSLNISSFHLMGHSMGGKAAMTFAVMYPQCLKSLIVVDIAPRSYPRGHDGIFQALFALKPERFTRRTELEEELSASIADPGVRLFLMKNLIKMPGTDGGYMFKMNLPVIYRSYEAISDKVEIPWPLALPVLFIKGEQSGYIRKEDEQDIISSFPEAQILSIPKAGHWVHAENPAAFIEAVQLFLSAI